MPGHYQKPLPNESTYKHLMMLINHLREFTVTSPANVKVDGAVLRVADRLATVANSRDMKVLLERGL